jgi:ASC-1-like (ASCH) protein
MPERAHVAVLMKPYLDLVLDGSKQVECRLTRQARAPYESIEPGERIWFKQSCGPFRATAVADHVLFEDDLTPRRVSEIRRDYDHLICGEPQFWRWKRDSRFCTLIWLRDVEPIDEGPPIRPLQGVAWLVLDQQKSATSAPRGDGRASAAPASAGTRASSPQGFAVTITGGNLRNSTLYVTQVIDQFPASAIGGATRAEAGRPVTLLLHEGPTVQTDIVGPRKVLRTRVWGEWFRHHGARHGDRVVFTPLDGQTFLVGLRPGE